MLTKGGIVVAIPEPFGITRFYTDGWGAYSRHREADKHEIGKQNLQKNRKQTYKSTEKNCIDLLLNFYEPDRRLLLGSQSISYISNYLL